MAKVFAPSFGDRPPVPAKKALPEFDDDNCDDFVVKLELDGDEYVRHFNVSQCRMEWLDDGDTSGGDDNQDAE